MEVNTLDFLGTYNYNMDPKKRVFVPAKYRDALQDGLVICKAPDHCLYLYSLEEWEPVAAQVKALPGSAEYRRFKRDFFKNADMAEMDSQGRHHQSRAGGVCRPSEGSGYRRRRQQV